MARMTKAIPDDDQYRTLVERSPDPMYVIRDGILIFVNPAAVRLFGAAMPGDLIGTRLLDRVHPAFQAVATARWKALADGVASIPRIESKFLRLDGTVIDVEVEVTAIVFQGAPAIYAAVRDISERKRAQELIAESSALFHAAFRVSPNPTSISRLADGVFVEVNDATTEVFGRSREELIGRSALDFNAWVDVREREGIVESLQRGEEVKNREVQLRWKDGRIVNTLTSAIPLTVRGVPHLMFTSQDISARKLTEEALRDSGRHFKTMFEESPFGISLIDSLTGQIRQVNPMFAKIAGRTVEQMASIDWMSITHPDDVQADLDNMARMNAGETTGFQMEKRYIRPGGDIVWIKMTIAALTWGEGVRRQHLSMIEDITERTQAEREKRHLEGQLAQAQKMESVGLLAGGVAHDFNNMLGVILGSAELALAQTGASQQIYEDLMEIKKAAIRSADLTRQLLAFARRQPVVPTVLDLNETVLGMRSMLQRLIGEDISLHWQPTAALWPVMMDPSQMDQMLTNLCVNARHAIANVGTVTIATANVVADAAFCAQHAEATPGNYVRLSVRDTGSGMDEATLAKIFEPFFSTKGVGAGTGLGLSTVYGAVKQNHGFVTVSSTPGEGATFEIYLPRHQGAVTPTRLSTAVSSDDRGGETILLVEDEPALMRLVRKALEAQRYVVLSASSAAGALRLATAHAGEIHLLLSDVVMPEMNGRDLAHALLQLRPTLKQLFMSGYTADVIAVRGLLAPEVMFIEKPFTPVALAAKVREVLGGE